MVLGVLAVVSAHIGTASWGHALFTRAFLMSPLVLPTIVTGVALLQFYYLIDMAAALPGLLIGHVLIRTIPYVVRTVGAGLAGLDPRDRGGLQQPRRRRACGRC